MTAIVLASSSKYRCQLLEKLGLAFLSCSSDVDESPQAGESPYALVRRLSLAKAEEVGKIYPNHLIIGSDQVAVLDQEILGKPGGRDAAIQQLAKQSGRTVQFYTGVCVFNSVSGRHLSDMDVCSVQFKTLTSSQIEKYIDLDRPFDCAGSFKSEGLGIALFSKIVGEDPNALVGLPLIKLVALLDKFGVNIL
ncbi:septum formation inhibitor Maf [Methylomonas sp. LW13]|uniref:Maf family protein n=1 Tax=unclassified Methylomonas TaxID=2608980 RepID=UPI00051C6578|nr:MULTISPECIES: nucleoside triphosphate pyrophosphatase [unclassified Methylomonas]PKD41893.1 septum formation inhibitor Maf [Methylomonas sp. Kb3]QBC26711.1 septum formation inhibitor Maf [Methylomonas sp. LW13]